MVVVQVVGDVEQLAVGRSGLAPAGDQHRVERDHVGADAGDRHRRGELESELTRRHPLLDELGGRGGEAPGGAHQPVPERVEGPEGGADHRPLGLAVDPRGKPAALLLLSQPAQDVHHAHDHGDRDAERERRLPRDARDPVERPVEDESQDREERGPQPAADDAEREEAAVAESRRPGNEGRQRPHEPDEPADQDRLPAVALEVGLDLAQALLVDLEPWAVPDDEAAPKPAADEEAGGVAQHAADPDEADAAGSARSRPGRRSPRRRSRWSRPARRGPRRRRSPGTPAPDQRIGPRAQRLSDVLDHLLGVGQVREDARGVEDRHRAPRPRAINSLRRCLGQARTSVTSEPGIRGRRGLGRRPVGKIPNAVGPEPVMRAPRAPASRRAASASSSSGRSDSAAASRSFCRAAASCVQDRPARARRGRGSGAGARRA